MKTEYPAEGEDLNQWSITRGDEGQVTVDYSLVLSGPLLTIYTILHINGSIEFSVNEQNEVDYAFTRDGFPWAEAYLHDGEGNVTTIFQDPAAKRSPYDLFAIEPNMGYCDVCGIWDTIPWGVRERPNSQFK